MIPWLLALLSLAAPPDAQPDVFGNLAAAIDRAAHGDPGDAAVLVALATRESHLRVDAVGHDRFGSSYGFFQLHETVLPGLGLTVDDAFSPERSAAKAEWMVAKSREVCRDRPPEERLAWYASGGPTCDVPAGIEASRNRMALAAWLLRRRPPFYSSGRLETTVLPKRAVVASGG